MAKISASLPDELKARMDAYIKEHPGTGISDVVQTALEQFLSGGQTVHPPAPPPVTPPTSPPPTSNLDQVARDYVLNLAIHVDNLRKSMAAAGLWAPPPIGAAALVAATSRKRLLGAGAEDGAEIRRQKEDTS